MHEPRPEDGRDHEVRVHIDQRLYVSPDPTTGIALPEDAGALRPIVKIPMRT